MTRKEALSKAIMTLMYFQAHFCKSKEAVENTQAVIDTLEEIEQEPDWIPVSERLPEVGSEVLVCFDFKGKRSVYISDFYGDGEFLGFDDEYLTSEGRKCRKAVAWMPLPEPARLENE